MSEKWNTYACSVCTYIQPRNAKKCEMCETSNPLLSKPTKTESFVSGNHSMACPMCSYVSHGSCIRVCEACEYDFETSGGPSKRGRIQKNKFGGQEQAYSDDDMQEGAASKAKDKKLKVVEALEKPMNEAELQSYYNTFISLQRDQWKKKLVSNKRQLADIITDLFRRLQCKNEKPEGQLHYEFCQICYDQDAPLIEMRACGHRVICADDFHQYLSTRIRDGDILPWIPCPAEVCNVPCDPKSIIENGKLENAELVSFITKYMLKKLSRNENFITCIQCERGGFLQMGAPRKEVVKCPVCGKQQTIEKGVDGDLDIAFKKMIQSGELRECPTCRHLTLKEKGLCNVIECAKCGIWWNWRTREQGHSGKDLKQRARSHGTLWEPGELEFQLELQWYNPAEFQALLERNGIEYDPNYVRGGWDEN